MCQRLSFRLCFLFTFAILGRVSVLLLRLRLLLGFLLFTRLLFALLLVGLVSVALLSIIRLVFASSLFVFVLGLLGVLGFGGPGLGL